MIRLRKERSRRREAWRVTQIVAARTVRTERGRRRFEGAWLERLQGRDPVAN